MRKIIVSILAIGLLLSTALVNVSGKEAIGKPSDVSITVKQIQGKTLNYDKNSMTDYSCNYSKTDLNSGDSNETQTESGGLDFAVTIFKAWYSPFPPRPGYEDCKYTCYVYEVRNIGDTCTVSGNIKILLTLIYSDGSTYLDAETDFAPNNGTIKKNELIQWYSIFYISPPEGLAVKAKLEIITDLPDINPENNVMTVDFLPGVTFWGQVYEKDIFGNTRYANMALISCDSEYDKVDNFQYSLGTYQIGLHDWYTMVAPKNPDKPPYEYKITAFLSLLRFQTKYSNPLNGMSYKEVYFTFLKILNQNSQSNPQSNPQSQPSSQPGAQPGSQSQPQINPSPSPNQQSTQPSAQQSVTSTTISSSMSTVTTAVTSTATTSKSTSLTN